MNPRPSDNVMDRKVMCAHYGACLDVALQKSWKGFTCAQCLDYAHVEMDPLEWLEDGIRCRALGYAVLHEDAHNASPMRSWVEAVERLTHAGA